MIPHETLLTLLKGLWSFTAWIAVPIAGLMLAAGFVMLPLIQSRNVAYQIWKSPFFARRLAQICYSRASKTVNRERALELLDLATATLSPSQLVTDEDHALYTNCLDVRAQIYEQSTRWDDANRDLTALTQTETADPRYVRWLEQLASANDNVGHHTQAHELRQKAHLIEKKRKISANAPAIEKIWPEIEYLVLDRIPDPAQLSKTLTEITTLARDQPTNFNVKYAKGLLELKSKQRTAASTLTEAVKFISPGFTDIYYYRAYALAEAGDFIGCLEDCKKLINSPRYESSARYLEGVAQFHLHHFDESAERFTLAIEADPTSVLAHLGLVSVKNRLQQWAAALEAADRVIKSGISDSEIFAARGVALFQLGNLEQALDSCSQALMLSTGNAVAYYIRALILFNRSRWAESIADLTAALSRDGNLVVSYGSISMTARVLLVVAALELYRVEKNEIGLLASADAEATRIVTEKPSDPIGYWALAQVKRARGQNQAAFDLVNKALEYDSGFTRARFLRGWLYLNQSSWSNAITDFTVAATDSDPSLRSEGNFGLGICHHEEGRLLQAISSYDKAIGLGLDNSSSIQPARVSEFYRQRALANYDRYRDPDADKDFAIAVERNPAFPDPLFDWGLMLVVSKRYTEGIAKMTQGIAIDPKSFIGFSFRGCAYAVAGDLDRALGDINMALGLAPTRAQSWNDRAWVHCKSRRWVEAISDCNRAADLGVSSDFIFKNCSLALWSVGRTDEALRDLVEMIRLRWSKNTAPAIKRDDAFYWADQAIDWKKAMADRGTDAVSELGRNLTLWMSGESGAPKRIRRLIKTNPDLENGPEIIRMIEKPKRSTLGVIETGKS